MRDRELSDMEKSELLSIISNLRIVGTQIDMLNCEEFQFNRGNINEPKLVLEDYDFDTRFNAMLKLVTEQP